MIFSTVCLWVIAHVISTMAGRQGPCDLYDADPSTECVAAYSLTRALYGAFDGSMYQVRRLEDNSTMDIGVLEPGGYVNAATQDAFCKRASCVIERIYDQSPRRNHLDVAKGGSANPMRARVSPSPSPQCYQEMQTVCGTARVAGNDVCVQCLINNRDTLTKVCTSQADCVAWCGDDAPVNATARRISLGGKYQAYAAVFEGGQGYRLDNTSGVAIGDEPESMYMVVDGRHYNDKCCFDFGNAETTNSDTGKGSMEAIYWGDGCGGSHHVGPQVRADLEDGCWDGTSTVKPNPQNTPISADFVVAMVKGDSRNHFALKGGDANDVRAEGGLKTLYNGMRPESAYNPMKKQGAIILGIGGDNSDWAVGTFFEGVITSGYASDATDAAVHANIAAAGYGMTSKAIVI